MNIFKANLERITRDIMKLAEFTSTEEPGYTRISFSEEDRRAREHLARLMEEEAGLTVGIDAVGNLIGRRQGKKQRPAIIIGSHTDTVMGGGRFDGMAGVVAGLEVVRLFAEKEIEILHPIEIVSFLAEEPSPFGISTVGSRGMAGMLSKDLLESLNDSKRMALSAAIEEMGGDPLKITEAKRASRDILAYLELHIEQGPSLFSQDIHIGVVTGIVGIYRGIINVVGKSNHAGTTQMETRKDALTAASEIVLALERISRDLDGVVGTIGKIEVFPNSSNVVPGNANMEMELRSLNASRAADALSLFKTALENIQKQRGIIINFKEWIGSDPVIFKEKIVEFICTACDQLEIPYLKMPSGAGHDASHMAKLAPTGMIFIPSRDGMSHCPEEWSEFEHICMGAELLARTITLLDREEDI